MRVIITAARKILIRLSILFLFVWFQKRRRACTSLLQNYEIKSNNSTKIKTIYLTAKESENFFI